MALMMLSAVLIGGCKSPLRDQKQPWMMTEEDAGEYVVQALENPSPDARRHAINRLGASRYVHQPSVLKALSLIARTDASQSVRTAALMAMGRASDPIVAETAVDILQACVTGEARPMPDELVRTEAVNNLTELSRKGMLPADVDDRVVSLGVELLQSDRSRNVRLAAAQLLGYCPRKQALFALADALDQRDFGICYEAERSLMRLTGRTFKHDAVAWRRFITSTDNPFAERGKLDDQLEPRERKWYEMWTADSASEKKSGV
jgi:hypothetical protein